MRGTFTGVVTALALVCACSDDGHSLTVDLRTDYLPGFDFTRVETTVEIGGETRDAIPSGASATDDFVTGQRIAEYTGLPAGDAQIRVTLRNPAGDLLATRLTRVPLDGETGVLVVISRACNGVSCPGATDAPDATECLNGECVPPSCMVAALSTCSGVECEVGASCASTVACVEPVCEGPACLQVARDERCASGERCDPELGCVAVAGDGGMPDGGDGGDGGAVDPSLVAHWSCDRLEDRVLEDVTGNGHDGTCSLSLCPAILPGRIGRACEFVREFPDSVVVPYHSDFDAEGGFTIALWMLVRELDGVSALAKPRGSGNGNSYKIALTDSGRANLEFTTSVDDMETHLLGYASASLVGDWHHVAATWDGTTKRLYVDGTDVNDAEASIAFDSSGLCIGCDEDNGVRTDYFEGFLDEIRFYDRALSPSEIDALASVP